MTMGAIVGRQCGVWRSYRLAQLWWETMVEGRSHTDCTDRHTWNLLRALLSVPDFYMLAVEYLPEAMRSYCHARFNLRCTRFIDSIRCTASPKV